MKRRPPRPLIVVLLLLSACTAPTPAPLPTAVPAALPTSTPDPLAEYAPALISGDQGDPALVDHPTRYSLDLTYSPDVPTLTGSENVVYTNRASAPLNEIYFRLFANYSTPSLSSAVIEPGRITVGSVSIDGQSTSTALEAQDTALRVALSQPLAPNASLDLHLDFNVKIPRNSTSHYADFTADDSITTMPSVYPIIPAYDSKGWHIEVPPPYGDLVYADASLYAVTMTVPTTITVIASGSTAATVDNHNGTTTWHVVGAPMRDFDLNVTSQLAHVSATVGATTVNSWYEAADADAGRSALDFATAALGVYAIRFGAYPYRELDVIETPTTAGGIEYPGAVSISRAFYRDSRNRSVFEFDVAHEVSHQWWYGMVGDDQVNQPWVDESLAQYSSLIYEEDTHGQDAANQILKSYFTAEFDRARNAGHDAPVNQPVSAYDESDYSAIVYGKGPLFYDAIRKRMGDTLFFQFLKTYFQRYRYRIATGDDILKTAQEVCNCSLQSEYDQWITSPSK
ncbi:MAG: hypothetical protein M1482_09870 [Chloroflexi bacterium]|nr:hypothetical protein [Chloroflexota bacterium]